VRQAYQPNKDVTHTVTILYFCCFRASSICGIVATPPIGAFNCVTFAPYISRLGHACTH
jgi:hypothetical protein